jgi:hypothetical protein
MIKDRDAYTTLEERINRYAEAARNDPGMAREVLITISGRDDSGHFHTISKATGPYWDAQRLLIIEVASMLFGPYTFLDDDVDDLHAAFNRIQVGAEAIGNGSYNVIVRPRPKPSTWPKCRRLMCGHGRMRHKQGGACSLYYCDCSSYE